MKSRTNKNPTGTSGNYPAISPTYWQASSSPGPYLLPGIGAMSRTYLCVIVGGLRVELLIVCIVLDLLCLL